MSESPGSRVAVFRTALLIACATSGGCSTGDRPDLGRVSGVVTINGEPTGNLGVVFSQEGFRSSSGFTNDRGEYELNYLKNIRGAVIGPHQVRIDYIIREGGGRRMRIPDRYNRKSELSAEVERGGNKIDFDLRLE